MQAVCTYDFYVHILNQYEWLV